VAAANTAATALQAACGHWLLKSLCLRSLVASPTRKPLPRSPPRQHQAQLRIVECVFHQDPAPQQGVGSVLARITVWQEFANSLPTSPAAVCLPSPDDALDHGLDGRLDYLAFLATYRASLSGARRIGPLPCLTCSRARRREGAHTASSDAGERNALMRPNFAPGIEGLQDTHGDQNEHGIRATRIRATASERHTAILTHKLRRAVRDAENEVIAAAYWNAKPLRQLTALRFRGQPARKAGSRRRRVSGPRRQGGAARTAIESGGRACATGRPRGYRIRLPHAQRKQRGLPSMIKDITSCAPLCGPWLLDPQPWPNAELGQLR